MEPLLKELAELYGFELSSPERVERGALCENYFLTQSATGQRFFLKKYRFDNAKRMQEVHSSKKYFADAGIPVILPLSLKNGDTFFCYESAYYALFPFVKGKHLARGEFTETSVKALGEMLGRMHLAGKDAKLPIDDRFKVELKEKVFQKISDLEIAIEKKISEQGIDNFDTIARNSVALKKKLLEEFYENENPFAKSISSDPDQRTLIQDSLKQLSDHLIHGDFLDHNVFFDDQDQIAWVFDFEKTCYSPRTYELFRCMLYALVSDSVSEKDLGFAKLFLNAYREVYPISDDEIHRGLKLFFLKSIHGFWVESEHYLKNNNRVDQFLESDYSVRIQYLSKNLEQFADFLCTA